MSRLLGFTSTEVPKSTQKYREAVADTAVGDPAAATPSLIFCVSRCREVQRSIKKKVVPSIDLYSKTEHFCSI